MGQRISFVILRTSRNRGLTVRVVKDLFAQINPRDFVNKAV